MHSAAHTRWRPHVHTHCVTPLQAAPAFQSKLSYIIAHMNTTLLWLKGNAGSILNVTLCSTRPPPAATRRMLQQAGGSSGGGQDTQATDAKIRMVVRQTE